MVSDNNIVNDYVEQRKEKKKMKKRAILVLVAVLMVSVFAFGLCACDDKDKNGNNNVNGNNENGIDFTGMTKEEIIELMWNPATNFTFIEEDKDNIYYTCYNFFENKCKHIKYFEKSLAEEDYVIKDEDGYSYFICSKYWDFEIKEWFDSPEISYRKYYGDLSDKFEILDWLREGFFEIDGTKLILDEDDSGKCYICDVNATNFEIPEKYSNYKELCS